MKIRKGDTVVVIKGKDRGKKAKVLRAFLHGGKIVVEGVNLKKKHRRPRRSGEKGQIISSAAPFSASNVKIVCGKCSKVVRVKYKGQGKERFRICSACSEKL